MEKRNNPLDFPAVLADLTPEETDVLLKGWREPPLSPAAARRIRKSVREKAGLAAPRSARRMLKWLAPIAACLILGITLLSIPSVAKAITNWFYESFDLDRYLSEPPEDREKNEDVEKAISTPVPGAQTFSIRYLDETEHADGVNEYRVKAGFGKFDRADYAFVEELKPEAAEVLYDGANLIVNTAFHVSPMKFAGGYSFTPIEGAERYDLYPIDIFATTDGTNWTRCDVGDCGLQIPWQYYDQETRSYNVDLLKAADVTYVQASIEPSEPPLFPSGTVTVKIVYWLFDGRIDDMATVGLVAEIEQCITLDTTEGNRLLAPADSVTTTLSGVVTATEGVHPENAESYYVNRAADLAGVTVTAALVQRTTGMSLNVHYEGTDTVNRELLGYGLPRTGGGLIYRLYVNGEPGGYLSWSGSSGSNRDDIQFEIPLTPAELANVTSLMLRPVFQHISSYSENPAYVYVTDASGNRSVDWEATAADATPIPLNEPVYTGSSTLFYAETELIGCDIVLPLP